MFWRTTIFLLSILTFCGAYCPDYSADGRNSQNEEYIEFNASTRFGAKNFEHFWESTGFCPPDPHDKSSEYMLSQDMYQNLALIGSLPHNGIKQIRIHFLLKLISVKNHSSNQIQYNFGLLDKFLTQLNSFGLKPGFEIMGNPSNIFNDFENKTQVYQWKDLIKQLVIHYIQLFGKDYVKTWNFESWNEPSIEFKTHFYDNIKITPKGFLNYYDASSQAIKEVDDQLIFGGPGDHWPSDTKNGPFVIDLVKHYINGSNYFTGKKNDIKLDFISLHEKGKGGQSSYTDYLENKALNDIKREFPELSHIPFVENEGDPEAGWNKNRTWRADNRYAATMVQVLARRILDYNHTNKLSLFGFDHGFLSFYPYQFTQRTLLARFQINNTLPHFTQFVRKPGFAVMGLLSKLGNNLIDFKTNISENSSFNAIATVFRGNERITLSDSRTNDFSILFVNSEDMIWSNKKTSIRFNLLFDENDMKVEDDWKWSLYQMDNNRSNPFRIWAKSNCTAFPSQQLFASMRDEEEPFIEVNAKEMIPLKNRWTHTFEVGFPGIALIQICRKTQESPKKLNHLKAVSVTKSSVLLVWTASDVRCLKTYEVQYSKTGSEETFERINKKDIIFPSFQYMIPANKTVHGFYRIRVCDFWQRRSDFTQIDLTQLTV